MAGRKALWQGTSALLPLPGGATRVHLPVAWCEDLSLELRKGALSRSKARRGRDGGMRRARLFLWAIEASATGSPGRELTGII